MTQLYFEEREESAREELKRADHLICVSLKYTRTCAVMMNAIKRLISAYEMAFDEYLRYALKKKKIDELPYTFKEKGLMVRNLIGTQVTAYISAYNKLVKIRKSAYCAIEECRKNVTLKTDGARPIEVTVATLEEYLGKAREFVTLIDKLSR